MSRLACFTLMSLGALQTFALVARAQPVDEAPSHWNAGAAAQQGMLLPALIAPGSARDSAAVTQFVAGYDSARESAVMSAVGDVAVLGPVDLRFGLTYTPEVAEGEVQPHFGLRLRFLDQAHHGVDAAALVLYRMERFTEDEGLIQGVFALGRRFGPLGIFANLAYGQDPEGDDREGEASLAALYAVSSPLQVGLESHLRVDLFSDDPNRELRGDPTFELTAGPTAHYSIGPVALLAQAGVSAVEIDHVRVGVIALGGVGGAY